MAEKLYAFFVLYVLHQQGELSGYRIAKIITEITEGRRALFGSKFKVQYCLHQTTEAF